MRFIFKALLALCLGTVQQGYAQSPDQVCYNPNLIRDTTKKSIRSLAYAKRFGDSIKVHYHSPGVRKRIIWGGLVPYGEVWVTGAHDATSLEMPTSFRMGGKEIPAGKYAFFTIPGEKEWWVILNRNWRQHLASEYDEKEDVVRVRVIPQPSEHLERLQYFIEMDGPQKGAISVAWEKIRLNVPFECIH